MSHWRLIVEASGRLIAWLGSMAGVARAGQKTRNPNSNPKYPKLKFYSVISGSNLQNPNLFRVIRGITIGYPKYPNYPNFHVSCTNGMLNY
jgi:hypothetical protein